MITRASYPHGVPCWVDVEQSDAAAAAAFYGGLFGWECTETRDGYLVARLHGHAVAGIATGDAAGWTTYVAVDRAAAAAERVRAAGGRVLAEPSDLGGIAVAATVADPAGAVIRVWEGSGGAALVNAPGTWNFSDLSTPDPRGATGFYGAVFGWEATDVDFGGPPAVMWRVPGYGDVLAALDPALRERHATDGVPDGFSDAVGWMATGEGPAGWAVTFAVEGTDAIADRAVALGGEVITAPYDAGPTRAAQLRDPGGARFTVSTYSPDG